MSKTSPSPAATLARIKEWVCDDYSLDLRYIAYDDGDGTTLIEASIALFPVQVSMENTLSISVPFFSAGQTQEVGVPKSRVLQIIQDALNGSIRVGGKDYQLPSDAGYSIHEANLDGAGWFTPLSFQITGAASPLFLSRKSLDDSLRQFAPPFDGVQDLVAWLGLRQPDSSNLCSITINVNPPIDLRTDLSTLSQGKLGLVIHAHPKADLSNFSVAIRAAPGEGLKGRQQITSRVVWAEPVSDRREGRVDCTVANATGVLAMLSIGSETVRRNWFIDPSKAPNQRYAAVQQFDSELRMIKNGLFEAAEAHRFEGGVAALLFMLGFSPTIQLETNSPDLIVASPVGRLILVECTTRMADVNAKVGKLVDRRGALAATMTYNNLQVDITAALVCRLPREQIASREAIKAAQIVLVAREDLSEGLNRALLPANPEAILDEAKLTLARSTG